MKDYDVKYATIAFTNNSNITGKRLAYLVPNMFNKLKSGFKKQIAPVVETYKAQNEELPTITPMVDVTPVMPDIPEMVAHGSAWRYSHHRRKCRSCGLHLSRRYH